MLYAWVLSPCCCCCCCCCCYLGEQSPSWVRPCSLEAPLKRYDEQNSGEGASMPHMLLGWLELPQLVLLLELLLLLLLLLLLRMQVPSLAARASGSVFPLGAPRRPQVC